MTESDRRKDETESGRGGVGDGTLSIGANLGSESAVECREATDRSESQSRHVVLVPQGQGTCEEYDTDVCRETGVTECTCRCRALHRTHKERGQWELTRLEECGE